MISDNKAPVTFKKILALADIRVDGGRPWDIRVHDERFYRRVFSDGLIAFGESYMDGWWDAEHLDAFFYKLQRADVWNKIRRDWRVFFPFLTEVVSNRWRKSKAYEVGERHYDLGNDLYQAMLDKRMVYSCGYWGNADDLDGAQEAKLDLVCRKLGFQKGMRILDIGCGWGSLAKYAAEKYGVSVVGITVSKEQVRLGQEHCRGLPVEIKFQDYRDSGGTFDRVISLGMFEHVGYKNYRTYMRVVHRCLADDGLSLLHTLGGNVSVMRNPSPWIEKYIFPNSMLPSIQQIGRAAEGLFVMEDWENFGFDYDRTLMAWFHNFQKNWPSLEAKYGERFYRMWKYYLLASAGTLRARVCQVWQIVFSKRGVEGGYRSIR